MSEATQTFTIQNALGLHARAAAKLVKITGKFQSEVLIAREGYSVNGKSILGLLTLAAACGTQMAWLRMIPCLMKATMQKRLSKLSWNASNRALARTD